MPSKIYKFDGGSNWRYKAELFYTTTFFSVIFYSLLVALPFLPIVAKISGWTRPDRQPCLSFSCYAPEHTHIYISGYTQTIPVILVLFSSSLHTILQTRKASASLSLVMHPSILQQDGHWTDPHSQTAINVTQQEIRNISQDCYWWKNSLDLLMKRAHSLDLFTKSLPQWLLKC